MDSDPRDRKCPMCDGAGRAGPELPIETGGWSPGGLGDNRATCSQCGGSGRIPPDTVKLLPSEIGKFWFGLAIGLMMLAWLFNVRC